SDLLEFKNFAHRTFQGIDLMFFIRSLKNIYMNHGGLENIFTEGYLPEKSVYQSLIHVRNIFFEIEHPLRTMKHISDVSKGSAGKRLNLFLMWMVRHDTQKVHFGLWKSIPSSALYIPLDLHCGNVARKLGLLTRKQNDWKAVEELTGNLRAFDPEDPVKYDFALFCMGVHHVSC
ncbi:MAG TPA: TIGR02757 family protein, partial [Spirochaetota bacterium]